MTAKQRADLVKKQKQDSLVDADPDLRYQDSLINTEDSGEDMEEESK